MAIEVAAGEQPKSAPVATTVYDVEHLATFSIAGAADKPPTKRNSADEDNLRASGGGLSHLAGKRQSKNQSQNQSQTAECCFAEPKEALERLFELEKLSGIWTLRMQIELKADQMLIFDCETNCVVEKFARADLSEPEAFSEYNNIYNNILVFTARPQAELQSSELHIFQCVSHQARQLVQDIKSWMMADGNEGAGAQLGANKQEKLNSSKSSGVEATTTPQASSHSKPIVTLASSNPDTSKQIQVNVSVKETVQVFNQIAALREKGKSSSSPTSSSCQRPALESADAVGQLQQQQQLQKQLSVRAQLAPKSVGSSPTSSLVSSCNSPPSSATDQPTARLNAATNSDGRKSNAADQDEKQLARAGDERKAPTGVKKTTAENSAAARASISRRDEVEQQAAVSSVESPAAAAAAASKQPGLLAPTSNKMANNHHDTSNHHHLSSSCSSSGASSQHHNTSATASSKQPLGQRRAHEPPPAGRSSGSSSSAAGNNSRGSPTPPTGSQLEQNQVSTNESYVSVLNHCFDDIEKFIGRLQYAATAQRELQLARRKDQRRSSSQSALNGNNLTGSSPNSSPATSLSASELALLSAQARGPSEDDYFEILSKFKLAFNLLARLKGCIHEPNAPELVHFLFTPLAIIIESARNVVPPIEPKLVGIPYLNKDAIDLLSNCCTSKESDLWFSLGPNWTHTIDINLLKVSRLPSSFQPIFSDGWAPVINELELIGLLSVPNKADHRQLASSNRSSGGSKYSEMHRAAATMLPDDIPIENMDPAAVGQMSRALVGIQSRPQSSEIKRNRRKHGANSANASRMHLQANGSFPILAHYVPDELDYSEGVIPQGYSSKMKTRRSTVPYNYQLAPYDPMSEQSADDYDPNSLYPNDDCFLPSSSDGYAELQQQQQQHHNYNIHSQLADDQIARRPMKLSHSQGPAHSRHRHSLAADQMAINRGGRGVPINSRPHHQQLVGRYRQQQDSYPLHQKASHRIHVDQDLAFERETMLADLGPVQTEWFFELKSRDALIVRVLFARDANNDKELSVRRGEILEVLDDTRKWWKTRNVNLQVAHVPHTIVAVMDQYQTLDELLMSSTAGISSRLEKANLADNLALTGAGDMMPIVKSDPNYVATRLATSKAHDRPVGRAAGDIQVRRSRDGRNNPKATAAGAFRYF